jgi:SNF2 family DNA or RNA helicase
MLHQLYDYQQKAHDRAIQSFSFDGNFLGQSIMTGDKIVHGAYPFPIGSGKSITALTTADTIHEKSATDALLIVCPKSVMATWTRQIAIHCDWPSAPFRWRGDKANTKKYISAMHSALVDPFPVFIVNIEAFQTVNKILWQTVTDFLNRNKVFVILDEAATIKTAKAKRTQNVTELMRPAAFRFILAGHLFSNSILEIYSPFEFLKPRFWKEQSPYFFEKKYTVHIQRRIMDGKTIEVIASQKDVREMMAKVEAQEKLAREKGKEVAYWVKQMRFDAEDLSRKLDYVKSLQQEVFDQIDHCCHWLHIEDRQLPPVHSEMIVEMSDREETVYSDFKNDLLTILETQEVLSVTTKGALFQKCRQIVGGFIDELHPIEDAIPSKLQAILDEVSLNEDSAIIVSNFRGIIKRATIELGKLAPTGALFGDTSQEERDRIVDEFSKGNIRFIVMNPAVAARGIDSLQSNCQLMYWIDLHVNPEIIEQTEGRIRRNGQTGICVFKYLLSVTQSGKDTIDRRCLNIVNDKQDALEAFHGLSKKDLKDFF